jgi:hypothetical protein
MCLFSIETSVCHDLFAMGASAHVARPVAHCRDPGPIATHSTGQCEGPPESQGSRRDFNLCALAHVRREARSGLGDRGSGVAAVITLAPCTTDRSTPVRIASHQGNQSACGPVSMVDVIASPSFDAAIASDGAAVSDSLNAAIASDGAEVSALVVPVDDNASISR